MIKKTTIPLYLFSFLALAASAPGAYAQELLADPYVGFGYGQYQLEFESPTTDDDFDESQDAMRVYAGTQLTKALAGEISVYDFDGGTDASISSDLEGVSIAALFTAPLHERFDLFAKVGWFWWESEIETAVPGDPILSQDDDGDDVFFGAGAKVGLTEAIDLRFEYDRFELDNDVNPDLDYASVSVQVSF